MSDGVRQLFPPEIKLALHMSLGGAPLEPEPQVPPRPLVNTTGNSPAFENQIAFAVEMSRRRELLRRSISESMAIQSFPPPLSRNSLRAQSEDIPHVSIQPDTLASSDPFIPMQPTPNTITPEELAAASSLEPLPLEPASASPFEPDLPMMQHLAVPMRQSLPPINRRAAIRANAKQVDISSQCFHQQLDRSFSFASAPSRIEHERGDWSRWRICLLFAARRKQSFSHTCKSPMQGVSCWQPSRTGTDFK